MAGLYDTRFNSLFELAHPPAVENNLLGSLGSMRPQFAPNAPPPRPTILEGMLSSLRPQQMPMTTWFGISGIQYAFHLYDFGIDFIEAPGIYLPCRMENRAWGGIYVGETDDLSQRLARGMRAHEKFQRIAVWTPTHIGILFMPGSTKRARLQVEADIRRRYAFPCNDQ
jgi:hypothetical protein